MRRKSASKLPSFEGELGAVGFDGATVVALDLEGLEDAAGLFRNGDVGARQQGAQAPDALAPLVGEEGYVEGDELLETVDHARQQGRIWRSMTATSVIEVCSVAISSSWLTSCTSSISI
jgi:hypothetical protein